MIEIYDSALSYHFYLLGEADVVQMFTFGKSELVCGCTVTYGAVNHKKNYQLIRDGEIVDEGYNFF